MKKRFKRIAALCLTVLLSLYTLAVPVYAEDELIPLDTEEATMTLSVSIQRDNITLAVYEVEVQTVFLPITELGGTRAVITADADGGISKISVNGQDLIAGAELEIIALHNGMPIHSGELTVADGDAIVFKCATVQVSSAPVSSRVTGITAPASSKPHPQSTSSKTTVSKSKIVSEKAVSETSSEETVSQADASSEQSSMASSKEATDDSRVNPNKYAWNDTLATALENASLWINLNSTDVMQLVSLSAAGKPAKTSDVERFLQDVKTRNGAYSNVRDLAVAVIACTFCGISAENVRGIDLVQNLIDLNNQVDADASAAALTLIALDSDHYAQADTSVRGGLVQRILSLQRSDGRFTSNGTYSDVQATALVLTALSNYKNLAGRQIALGISYLSAKIKKDAYENNSISVAASIIALNTLGFSMEDERFIAQGKNPVQLLLSHQNADGGFSLLADEMSDVYATEYAVLALVSLKNGLSPYVINYQSQKTDVQPSDTDFRHNLYLSVVLAGLFFAIVAMTAVGFVYFRKKHSTNDRSEMLYELQDEP